MNFPSVNIQGNIISGDILEKVRGEEHKYQSSADFGFDRNTKVRDEVGLAWSSVRGLWQTFKIRKERIGENESGTSETRNFWMLPFFTTLGYDVEKSNAVNLDGKTYAISHRSANLQSFPIHIMGIHDSLDRRRETGGPRLSPHALVQEYLNKTDEHLYAIVTNGQHLRLLRDATRLVRLTYLEFDLEKMMEEELFSDFAILYRILHVSRMPKNKGEGEASVIEYYHQESMAAGTRIREKLSLAVEASIRRLTNGFISHPENKELRDAINSGKLDAQQYYLQSLRLVYRILFLLVVEDRGLVYPDKRDEDLQKRRKAYYDYYSIDRIRKLAIRKLFIEGKKHDLWEAVKVTFRLFESAKFGARLGIQPLGSGIFHPDALGMLSNLCLRNADLLEVVQRLCYFQDEERRQLVKVNYGDLDVEEFGSIYEGLLEYEPTFTDINGQPHFAFVEGTERSSSGSHYTPEELVRPLIQHSLDYIIQDCLEKPEERLKLTNSTVPKRNLQEKALLNIKVCDVACGSGHILLSAARKIATELAKVRTGEDQPTPVAIRQATRDVIRECIYGVDKNPLAIELCKVALWLEAHNPGEPLNFLDHHIKCGDAIVGLAHKEELQNGIADEAFKALSGDDKEVARAYAKRNKTERTMRGQTTFDFNGSLGNGLDNVLEAFQKFSQLPENTPEQIEAKSAAYNKLIHSGGLQRLKTLADIQVAQFFIPKTLANKDYLVTDSSYFQYLKGLKSVPEDIVREKSLFATIVGDKRFFHWFLEFPEVFQYGGFDCILGNPPFLGGGKISTTLGLAYLSYLFNSYTGANGLADFVVYFFRRNFDILSNTGFLSCISTNTISQGDTRSSGLDIITDQKGEIVFANKNVKWPGVAAVEVTLLSISKAKTNSIKYLKGRVVETINSYLEDSDTNSVASKLKTNADKSYLGTAVQGSGFILSNNEAQGLLYNIKNKKFIQKYLTGEDVNGDPNQEPSHFVLNFKDSSVEEAKKSPELLQIVVDRVKPERDKNNRKAYRDYWWQFGEKRSSLYTSLSTSSEIYLSSRLTKFLAFTKVKNTPTVYSDALVVICESRSFVYTIISSSIFSEWAWRNGSTMGTGTLRFGPSDCFETFPFLRATTVYQEQNLEYIGEHYHDLRKQLMLQIQLGLTKTYNLFHSGSLRAVTAAEAAEDKVFEKLVGKEAAQLRKHLAKTPGTVSFNEAVTSIEKLRELHVQMDEAVLEAYGWQDIQMRHGFYEVDYLPENDRVRYTIHPDARKEVLKRLLELNHQIFEEEAKKGLHKEKDVKAFYEQKGKPVPEGISFSDKKGKGKKASKKKKAKASEKEQADLFTATTPLFAQAATTIKKVEEGSKVIIRHADGREMKYVLIQQAEKRSLTPDGFKQISPDSALASALSGKKEGEEFVFGEVDYVVTKVY